MRHLFGGGSQRGSTILAALLLVVTVGVFSTVLHYGKSLNDHITYQSRGLMAQAGYMSPVAPAPAPLNLAGTPSGTTEATKPPNTTQKLCSDNQIKSGQSSTGSSGGYGNGEIKFKGQCLPGCKYKVSVSGDGSSKEGTYQATNPKDVSDSSKPCTVCIESSCYSQKVDAGGNAVSDSVMECDSNGENCKSSASTSGGAETKAAEAAKASSAGLEAAKQVAEAPNAGAAADVANKFTNFGQDPEAVKDLQAGLAAQEASLNSGMLKNEPGFNTARSNIDQIKSQIDALAGPLGGGGGTPAPTPDTSDISTYPPGFFTTKLGITGQPGGGNTPAPVPLPAPDTTPRAPGVPDTSFPGGFGGGSMTSGIASFLGGVMRGMGYGGMGGYGGYGGYGSQYGGSSIPAGNTIPQGAGSCNTQYICSGQTLLYRNNQCVDQPMQQCPYGCNGNQCAQQNGQQGQYGYGTDGQSCMQPPAQPAPAQCTTGTWKPTSNTNNGCTTGWQCVPGSNTNTDPPIASLSCQSQVADVGSTFAISYSCQRAADSIGGGFDTRGQLAGATTTTIGNPPAGTNTATYTLGCRNVVGLVVGAQCSVQINKPLIALTTIPSSVTSGATSTVGWVTSGMQSCVISSPDNVAFTMQNASSTNVNGVAITPPLTSTTRIQLTCTTFGGGTRATSTTIGVFSE
jgi:hypothetical protein